MGPMAIGAGVGAGAGLLKYFSDVERDRKNRALQAQVAALSPWTKIQPDMQNLDTANLWGGVLQGAGAGATFGQGMETAGLNEKLAQSEIDRNNRMYMTPEQELAMRQGRMGIV